MNKIKTMLKNIICNILAYTLAYLIVGLIQIVEWSIRLIVGTMNYMSHIIFIVLYKTLHKLAK